MVSRARQCAVLLQRADRGNQHDLPGVGEHGGDVGQPALVLGAIGHGEPQVGVQAVAQVVPVENVGGATLFEQLLLDEHRHRRLARPGQAGEPHGPALRQPVLGVAQRLVAHGVRDCDGARRDERAASCPPPTVPLVAGSMRMNEPVADVAAVLVEQQRHLGAQRDAAELIEFERGGRLVAVQRVDVEPVVQRGHLRPAWCGWCA